MADANKKTPLSLKKRKEPTSETCSSKSSWKILVVDDEPEIHSVTKLVLSQIVFQGKKIDLIGAYSGAEAKPMFDAHPDLALVLLDVVMEEDDSGLKLAKYIREVLNNSRVRIILRTGQPGQAPEKKVIVEYDINDYKAKSELTDDKLFTSVVMSLKAYQGLCDLENAIIEKMRLQAEFKTAKALQKAFFPVELPEENNLKFGSYFQSATETGGDWYGFIDHPPASLGLMIGDVTGHGLPAALITATACSTCRLTESLHNYLAEYNLLSPSTLLELLNNNILLAGKSEFLMTFFLAFIDTENGMMRFSNAGHNFPIILKKDHTLQRLRNVNYRLGDKQSSNFKEETVLLEDQDLMILYTDGLIENTNHAMQPWTEKRLIQSIRRHADQPPQTLVERVVEDAFQFYDGHPIEDDLTLVACKVTAPFPKPVLSWMSLPVDPTSDKGLGVKRLSIASS